MTYTVGVMTQEHAENIAFNWHYDGEYSFYDMEADKDDLAEFVDPDKRGDSMFAVTKGNELIGFFSVNKVDNNTFDIGLGMRPDLTGSGNGLEFLKVGIDFVQSKYTPDKITLAVATFNKRAIKVYRKIGFKDINTCMQHTNGSSYEFLRMTLEC